VLSETCGAGVPTVDSFTGPAAAEGPVAANGDLGRITIEHAGDLPQLERPDETAAVIDRFLA